MTERMIDSEIWGHPKFEPLSPNAKLLYLYSWTNERCKAAGIYHITYRKIANETKLRADRIPALLHSLVGMKVVYFEDRQILWVKNFVKRQTKSPKFLIAVAKNLQELGDEGLVKEFLEYNDTLSIPYPYTTNNVSIPYRYISGSGSGTDTDKEEGVVKGEIFKAYEQNIGILTPMIGEKIKDALTIYPEQWIEEAIGIAVKQNARRWSYIEGILKRWEQDGKGSSKSARVPDKYERPDDL